MLIPRTSKVKIMGFLCWVPLVGCGPNKAQPGATRTLIHGGPANDFTDPSPKGMTKSAVDLLIKQREEATLARLQNGDHKNKPIIELIQRSRVGKATEADFNQLFSSAAIAVATHPTEILKNSYYLEYKRIWYLADDAYKAIRSKKFQPELKLIPYLRSVVSQDQAALLHWIFSAELKRESMDPRALGAECSEMLKLTTIVQELKTLVETKSH